MKEILKAMRKKIVIGRIVKGLYFYAISAMCRGDIIVLKIKNVIYVAYIFLTRSLHKKKTAA